MTRQEYKDLIHQLPQHLFEQYKFKDPYNFSNTPCIHTEEYDYYPEECAVVIDGITVAWDDDLPHADPRIPEHFAEMKRRITRRLQTPTIGVIDVGIHDKRMVCWLQDPNRFKSDNTKYIQFDNTYIYYHPDNIDLEHNHDMQLLAKCLFAAQKYEMEYIIPEKGQDPKEWGC